MEKLFLNIKLPLSIFKEDRSFVAYTPVLDLSTSAKTFEEVQKRFKELVEIFFEELFKKGTLDDVLLGLGWRKIQQRWSPPPIVFHESKEMRIPIKI